MGDITFLDLLNEYGLLVVLVGILSSIICGILKIPIAKKIRSLDITDKAKSSRIRSVCMVIVAVLSVAGIVLYRCLTVHSITPFMSKDLYTEILSAITFSQIAYMMYEGVGPVSIKKWIHDFIGKIKSKSNGISKEEKDEISNWVDIVQSALLEMHMPMTDNQRALLDEKLRGVNDGATESEDTKQEES